MPDEVRDPDKRPSPEALLEAARREEGRTGRLRIFVGAAPGVGKTYTMLETARARKKDGYDVVIGVVETHGRKETEALTEGLEAVPRRRVEYKGRWLDEMDLDAVLARRPQIVLVDELAHTNAAGSRHPKRYLDVEELLAAGINVYSTVNIQHIESLNDVVAQITHVRVRETIPDAIFDRADAVELVDLTPDDLIQRLKDGKVYVPAQARRALDRFFSPANLNALRELALRRTADRVDGQLRSEMLARAIEGPWAAGERVLVCVSEDPRAAGLVRYAKRVADRLHGPLTALNVETPRSLTLSEEQRDRIADTLRLAQGLGGDAITIPGGGRHIADDVIAWARANNVTHIVIGKSTRSWWFEMLHGSVVHDLVQRSGNISVHVVSGEDLNRGTIPPKTVATAAPPSFELRSYGLVTLVIAIAVGVGRVLWPAIGIENIDLVFITAIVGIAVVLGLWPSLFASVAFALCYNFFFTEPYLTFQIADPRHVLAVAFFAVVALVVSNVAARARMQALVATGRARATELLFAFSRKLSGVGTLDDVLYVTAYQTAAMLRVRVVILLPEDGTIAVKASYPPEEVSDADLAVAQWAWQHDRSAGRGSDNLPGGAWLFLPMHTSRGLTGIIGIDRDKAGPLLTPDQRRLLDALIDQGALAIERVKLVEDMEQVRRTVDAERLRAALLTSISHDLKTPLASVLGSAEALRDMSPKLTADERTDLLANIIEESERLNRFIANLLDMTRLESGAVVPNLAAHDVKEIIGSALRRAGKVLARHRVELDLAGDLPLLDLDDVLFEQVLFNILDNAAKYAPAGTAIRVGGRRADGNVVVEIQDEGPGIPPDETEYIFDKFYRVQKGDQTQAGTGLGLAISRGFTEAMHGTLRA
ncbi:MAG: DUF4118 domain-containing protein, partial [Alphaproteobacteria bacterium]